MPDIGDELYGLPPTEFIAARKALAARLKADGEREAAAMVTKRRRPTAAAAELNRILRSEPGAVEDLIAAGERLRDASQRLLQGEQPAVEPLRNEHRAKAELLARHAQRDQAQLQTALEMASLDEALYQRLRAAVFVELPTPTQGFDLLTPVASTRTPPTRSGVSPKARPEQRSTEKNPAKKGSARRISKEKLAERAGRSPEPGIDMAAKEAEERAVALDRAARRRGAAEQRVATSRQRVADLESRLEAAMDHLRHSEAQLEAARVAEERAVSDGPTTTR